MPDLVRGIKAQIVSRKQAAIQLVLGCGGTILQSLGNRITEEDAWNDMPNGGATGGGVSVHFHLPTWQLAANVPLGSNKRPGRGVPDVAGDAAPATGYQIDVDGQSGVVGGTSAVAPLWAGLVARLNQLVGQLVGFLNPLLYSKLPQDLLNDITRGNNGQYSAGPGWDPCTGLGSPNAANILAALQPTGGVTRSPRGKRRGTTPKKPKTKVQKKTSRRARTGKKER